MKVTRVLITVTMLLAWVFPVHAETVKYTDILLSPEKYLNQEVTMQGAFYYKNTERKSFSMKQGDNKIEVFFERLPKATQAGILGEKNFSKTPVVVKGVLKRFGNAKNSYYIMATAVGGIRAARAGGGAAGLLYTDILLSPEKYLNQEVTMQGAFYYKNTERKSFSMKQGDNKIEVFFERLPKATQAGILGEKNFSKTPVVVKGVLKRFGNAKNSYYIMATAVSLK